MAEGLCRGRGRGRGALALNMANWKPFGEPSDLQNNNIIGFVAPKTTKLTGKSCQEEEDDDEFVDLAATSLLNKLIHKSLVESAQCVEVLQRDPTSPLYSVKSFEELRLKPELLKGVYEMGFNRPSKIQETALPMMLAYPPQNLIAQSQSGTGKTAAFVLAILSRVDPLKKYPQCICLSPTFELALQTGEVIEQMGTFCEDIQIVYALRGNRPVRGTKIEAQIIVGTPGTVMDWCLKLKLVNPENISVFVLDEADVMIGVQGYSDHSMRVKRVMPQTCQMLLFSATFEDTVWGFAERLVPNPNIIKLKKEEMTLDNILQFYDACEDKEAKYNALRNIYGVFTIAQAIVFCRTRRTAKWLSCEMVKDGHKVVLLSGELSVTERACAIQYFREGKVKVLITTNVCARGIDVEQVSIVINFHLPVNMDGQVDFETYLHRIGRTGRFGKKGIAITLIEKHYFDMLRDIEDYFHTSIKRLDTGDVFQLETFLPAGF
ncbi:ATP-dependent RNA helicase DDX25-like [Rana temporaria]|uniref:ATP-dependent RNA helicase DDX25-like n=1 Tax=Rana temporaria TaxID=8407 RepID=UPI001AACA80D|nr:ATP-dependent RNA helicase DDX25-like [Rana temporaria]